MLPLLPSNWSILSSCGRPTSPSSTLRLNSNVGSGTPYDAASSSDSGFGRSAGHHDGARSIASSASPADDASCWSLPLSDANTLPTSIASSEGGRAPTLPSTANTTSAYSSAPEPPSSVLSSTRRRLCKLRSKDDKDCRWHCTYSNCEASGKCSQLKTYNRHEASHTNRFACKICHEGPKMADIIKKLDCYCSPAMLKDPIYHLEQHRLRMDFGGKQAGGKLMKLYLQRKSLEDHLVNKHKKLPSDAIDLSKEWKFSIRTYEACGMCPDETIYSRSIDLQEHMMSHHYYNNALSIEFNLDVLIRKLLKSDQDLDRLFQSCITGRHAPAESIMLTWQDTDSTGILDSLVLRMELEAFRLSPSELAALAARYVHIMDVDQGPNKKIGVRYELDKTIASKSGLSCLVTDPFMGRSFGPSSYGSGSSNESMKYLEQQRLLRKASESGISMHGYGLNRNPRISDRPATVDPDLLEDREIGTPNAGTSSSAFHANLPLRISPASSFGSQFAHPVAEAVASPTAAQDYDGGFTRVSSSSRVPANRKTFNDELEESEPPQSPTGVKRKMTDGKRMENTSEPRRKATSDKIAVSPQLLGKYSKR